MRTHRHIGLFAQHQFGAAFIVGKLFQYLFRALAQGHREHGYGRAVGRSDQHGKWLRRHHAYGEHLIVAAYLGHAHRGNALFVDRRDIGHGIVELFRGGQFSGRGKQRALVADFHDDLFGHSHGRLYL